MKMMEARFPSKCHVCGASIAKGERIGFERVDGKGRACHEKCVGGESATKSANEWKPAFQPTAEQRAIIEAAKTGESVLVKAGAGSGKTTTLGFVAAALSGKSVLYLAFSKPLQTEAEAKIMKGELPSNIEPRTAHSLAYKPMAQVYDFRVKHGKHAKGKDVAALLGIDHFNGKDNEGEAVAVSARSQGFMVSETIVKFCQSSDREANIWHVRRAHVLPTALNEATAAQLEQRILRFAQAAWKRIADPKDTFPFLGGRGDGCYLKLFALTDPQLSYDVLLFDEAQDADPCIAHIVDVQPDRVQRVLVGDQAQAIFEWRGAIDAMAKFDAAHTLTLTQSFRFGQAVADEANKILPYIAPDMTMRGLESIQSEIKALEKPQAILCRTNAGVIMAAMEGQKRGMRVAIAKGTREIEEFCWTANSLMKGETPERPAPALIGYHDWNEVLQAVEAGEAGDIAMMVNLVKNYGVAAIISVCKASEDADSPEFRQAMKDGTAMMISTAHKAKGLEWDSVQIAGDFRQPENGAISKAEARLIYVAITRAKRELDMEALSWIEEAIAQAMDEAAERETGLDEYGKDIEDLLL